MLPFLLTALIFYLAVRYGLPLLLRWVLGRVVRQATGGAFGGQFGGRPTGGGSSGGGTAGRGPRPASAPDGRVRVAYAPPRTKRQPRPGGYGGGEYVEFEEVKAAGR